MSEKHDPVTNPSHYNLLPGIQVIDIATAILKKVPSDVSYVAINHWSRSWEYLTRMWGKNGLEDAKKAAWYLERLIIELEKQKLIKKE